MIYASRIHDPCDRTARQRWRVDTGIFRCGDDEDQPLESVRIVATVADGAPIEVVGELNLADIRKAGILRGEVLSVRKAIAARTRAGESGLSDRAEWIVV